MFFIKLAERRDVIIINQCLQHYQKLINLLEEDRESISLAFKDDLLDSYRDIISKEISEVKKYKDILKRINN